MTTGFALSQKMMPYVKNEIYHLPLGLFAGIETATIDQDMHEATDLVINLVGGTMAVRVRGFKYGTPRMLGFDWSVRFKTRTNKRTEIDKLRDGFCKWYFVGRANEEENGIYDFCIIDIDKCRKLEMFDDSLWQVYPNGDGSAGGYLYIGKVIELGCSLYPTSMDGEHEKALDISQAWIERGSQASAGDG